MANLFKQQAGDKKSLGKIVKLIKEKGKRVLLETMFEKPKGFRYWVNLYMFEKYYKSIERNPKEKK